MYYFSFFQNHQTRWKEKEKEEKALKKDLTTSRNTEQLAARLSKNIDSWWKQSMMKVLEEITSKDKFLEEGKHEIAAKGPIPRLIIILSLVSMEIMCRVCSSSSTVSDCSSAWKSKT